MTFIAHANLDIFTWVFLGGLLVVGGLVAYIAWWASVAGKEAKEEREKNSGLSSPTEATPPPLPKRNEEEA